MEKAQLVKIIIAAIVLIAAAVMIICYLMSGSGGASPERTRELTTLPVQMVAPVEPFTLV